MDKTYAILPCAGMSRRMGGRVSKPYIEVLGRPLLAYTLDKFQAHPAINGIIILTRTDEISMCWEEIVNKYGFDKVETVAAGGPERQDSVAVGLSLLDKDVKWVVIHDGARPNVSGETITNVLQAAQRDGAAVAGVPVKDTIKIADPNGLIIETLERDSLWQVQTPQAFKRDLIDDAYHQAGLLGWKATDDASLVEKLGVKVRLVSGEYSNIKITTPEDVLLFKELLRVVS